MRKTIAINIARTPSGMHPVIVLFVVEKSRDPGAAQPILCRVGTTGITPVFPTTQRNPLNASPTGYPRSACNAGQGEGKRFLCDPGAKASVSYPDSYSGQYKSQRRFTARGYVDPDHPNTHQKISAIRFSHSPELVSETFWVIALITHKMVRHVLLLTFARMIDIDFLTRMAHVTALHRAAPAPITEDWPASSFSLFYSQKFIGALSDVEEFWWQRIMKVNPLLPSQLHKDTLEIPVEISIAIGSTVAWRSWITLSKVNVASAAELEQWIKPGGEGAKGWGPVSILWMCELVCVDFQKVILTL